MRAMMEHVEVEIQNHCFLTSPQDGGEWSVLQPGRFTLGKSPPVPTGIWMDPTDGASKLNKIQIFYLLSLKGIDPRLLGRPARIPVTIPITLIRLPKWTENEEIHT